MKVLMEKRAMSRQLMPASIPAAHSRELSVSRGDSSPDSTTCLDAASSDASLDVSGQGHQPDESIAGGMNLSLTTRNVVKRTIDIVGASSLLIAMSPILLIMGAIVMSDGGRPVFGHVRIGRNGRSQGFGEPGLEMEQLIEPGTELGVDGGPRNWRPLR